MKLGLRVQANVECTQATLSRDVGKCKTRTGYVYASLLNVTSSYYLMQDKNYTYAHVKHASTTRGGVHTICEMLTVISIRHYLSHLTLSHYI